MNDILHDLQEADRRGVNPPQNWTTRASNEIERLRNVLAAIADYGDDNGICPYGCDTPNIASEALKKYGEQLEDETSPDAI